jgi:hypothetical protein
VLPDTCAASEVASKWESTECANAHFRQAFRWAKAALLFAMGMVLVIATNFVLHYLDIHQADPLLEYRFVPLAALGLGLSIVVVLVWFYVFLGSLQERGRWYATWHLVLIVILTPVLLVGLFTIPWLVNGDALRLREWERNRAATP